MGKISKYCYNHGNDFISVTQMRRIYWRIDGKFVPMGWVCPSCKAVELD